MKTCQLCQAETIIDAGGLCTKCRQLESSTIQPVTPTAHDGAMETIPPSDSNLASPKTTISSSKPKTIGEYEIIDEIARGGMGVVFKARHKKLNRIAAVKMILGGRFSSPDELQRFQIEAESAALLDHPGIVPVFEIGEQDGQPFFAMKYIEGGSLADGMASFRSDHKKAAELIANVSSAVHHAHLRGILHRDLKPANILLDENSEPMITDLGLAKSTHGNSDLTNTGAVLGTPSYMAPEQASGNQSITTAADIFSIGTIFYELLTGRPPHKKATTIETVMSVISDTPDAPRKLNREIDPELELICLKCIEKDPTRRYESAAALSEDLQNWLDGNAISIKAPSIGIRTARWFKHHKQLAYAMFAMLTGLAFAIPLITSFLGTDTSSFGEVYEHFPDAKKPLLFSFGKFPSWANNIAGGLFLVIWPSIGLLNALVTKPRSLGEALRAGALTSLVCALITTGVFGWIVMALNAGEVSSEYVETLAQAIWQPEGLTAEEALTAANSINGGLDQIPEEKRAEIIADLVINEQVGAAPRSVLMICLLSFTLGFPVVIGTIIAQSLLSRRLRIWLVVLRYFVAWFCVISGLLILIGVVIDKIVTSSNVEEFSSAAQSMDQNPSSGFFPIILVAVPFLLLWLTMRRWKKKNGGETVNESAMFDQTLAPNSSNA